MSMSEIYSLVKLNNPLMGTETSFAKIAIKASFSLLSVKLNNPLMGTETFTQDRMTFLFHLDWLLN